MRSIRIIQDEHRSITAILEGLCRVLAEVDAGRMAPDFNLLMAMFRYIEAFPERLHHPKEDDFLFARLKLRCPEAAPLLDRLHAEHEQGRLKFAELKAALDEYRRDAGTFRSFRECVERYSHFHWLHMRREEDEVLPLAAAALTTEDWESIDAAFASNNNLIVGVAATREFRALFRRIVSLAPPPLGVGPEAPKRR
jgi:branched-chain amino acid transport system ATP-binding protein